jgi:hypothetical protein
MKNDKLPFFVTPKYNVAINAKVCTSSLARAILETHYPDTADKYRRAAFPAGKTYENVMWQSAVPKTTEPTLPVVLLVREPVDRFLSAMAQVQITDVDAALDALEKGTPILCPRPNTVQDLRDNEHFVLQSVFLKVTSEALLYRYPVDLEALAGLLELQYPLPVMNETVVEKVMLTEPQNERVLAYYADDANLFASIKKAGQVHVSVIEPDVVKKVSVLSKLTLRRRLRAAGLEAAFDAMLASNPVAQHDWDDATEIHTDDPVFSQMLPQFTESLGVSGETLSQILAP